MPTEEILKTYSVVELKREIGKARIKGYSKLKKAEVVSLMMKNKEKFHHLKGKGKAPKATGGAKPAPKPKAKPAPKPKAVAKPAKKEPAFLPDNVMANIKGFMNVGKDAVKYTIIYRKGARDHMETFWTKNKAGKLIRFSHDNTFAKKTDLEKFFKSWKFSLIISLYWHMEFAGKKGTGELFLTEEELKERCRKNPNYLFTVIYPFNHSHDLMKVKDAGWGGERSPTTWEYKGMEEGKDKKWLSRQLAEGRKRVTEGREFQSFVTDLFKPRKPTSKIPGKFKFIPLGATPASFAPQYEKKSEGQKWQTKDMSN